MDLPLSTMIWQRKLYKIKRTALRHMGNSVERADEPKILVSPAQHARQVR